MSVAQAWSLETRPRARRARPPRRVLHRLRHDPLGLFLELQRTQGDVAVAPFGRDRFVLVSHPDQIARVLVEDAVSYERTVYAYRGWRRARPTPFRGWFQPTSDPEVHLWARRRLQPVYSRAHADACFPAFRELADEAVSGWRAGETIDVLLEARKAMLRLGSHALFGGDLLPPEELLQPIAELLQVTVTATSPLHEVADRLRLRRLQRRAYAFEGLLDVLAGELAERRHNGAGGDDVLSLLVRAAEERPIDDHDLALEAFGHLFSLPDSTVSVAAWALYLLWRNPDVRARVAAESAGPSSSPKELPYTTAFLHETLRLYPPGWRIARRVVERTRIAELELEPGDHVWTSQYVVHRDSRWWDEPAACLPERWLGGSERPKLSFLPFGAGLRTCAGTSIALNELLAFVSAVTARWRPTLPAGTVVHEWAGPALRPLGGLRMTLERA